ncbi:MAG: Rod binding domain-containing protein [Lentimonas sp.]|jgi:Rod binding domain-containing protein
MKRSSLYPYLGVWLASIALAFFIGRALASTGASTQQTASEALGTAQIQEPTRSDPARGDTGAAAEEEAAATLELLSSQSSQMTRQLLNAAFAVPMSDPGRSGTINKLLEQLAMSDPLAALEFTEGIASRRDAERARNNILEVWASNEPMAALAWADNALADVPYNLRNSQMEAIIRGFAETNPKGAFTYANALGEDSASDLRLKNRLLSEVIETQIRSGGLEEAHATIALMVDGPSKDNLQRELVNEWATFDPVSAAAYVQGLGSDASTGMKTALIGEWAESDPAAAAEWLSNISAQDPAYRQATTQITREWTRYDLTASSEWLNSLPASPELDRAVATYTYRAAQEDPPSAMSWAESINNPSMRNRMMQQVAANWKNDDPEGFTSYLDNSELSQKEREQLETAKSWHSSGHGR